MTEDHAHRAGETIGMKTTDTPMTVQAAASTRVDSAVDEAATGVEEEEEEAAAEVEAETVPEEAASIEAWTTRSETTVMVVEACSTSRAACNICIALGPGRVAREASSHGVCWVMNVQEAQGSHYFLFMIKIAKIIC